MTQTNPNMVAIYSPSGEKFEVSRINARDLSNHGWTYNQVVAAATPPAPPAPVPAPAPAPTPAPVTPPAPPVETPTEVTETPAAATEEATADEAPKARLTEEDFADLADKKDVFAYIEQTFPGNKIDGRANREKLIAFAIELATKA